MTAAPDQYMIDHALQVAAQSPCRSKRGVALYDMRTGAFRGAGFNGPPGGVCPGRAICAGTCGQRSVHAEVRALREAAAYMVHHDGGPWDLIHVELAADGGHCLGRPFTRWIADRASPLVVTDGGVVACDGPSCPGCAAQILDVGFVGGVWLYEDDVLLPGEPPLRGSAWRRYTVQEFYDVTMQRCAVLP